MKIVYLHQYFVSPDEAGATRSYEFARRWVSQGMDVHIVTTNRNPQGHRRGWTIRCVDGIWVHALVVPYDNNMGFWERLRAFCFFALWAGPRVVKIGADVIFATSTPLTIAIPAVWSKWRLQKPMVFEVRDLWPDLPIAVGAIKNPFIIGFTRWLERKAYVHADKIIALSPGMANAIVSSGVEAEKVVTISNGCDLEEFSRGDPRAFLDNNPQLDGRNIVLYAGTLGSINGIGYIIDIAKEMREVDTSCVFVVIGDGRECDDIVGDADRKGVLGCNFFRFPPLPKTSMPDVFAACAVATSFVIDLKALWNNSANKFFDALAAGKPIVINHGGWQADIIAKEKCGLVIPARDARRAARMLSDLINDRAALELYGRNAGRLARSAYSRDELAARALSTLEVAANSGAH